MSRQVTLPIDNHDAPGMCTQYYVVEYKPQSDPNYAVLSPNPMDSPIVIDNLLDDIIYDIRVTRFCCNGQSSIAASTTVDTTV